jgi:hypothetical protein
MPFCTKQTHIFLHWGKQQQHNLPLIIFFISIWFDFRMQIIQPGTVAMAPSAHGSQLSSASNKKFSVTLWSGFDINGCPIARGKWKRHTTCPIGQVKMILWYVQFLKSKMINIELFSVGSRGEFYLNIASYVQGSPNQAKWATSSPWFQ